jgi:hypothetical protein
MYTDPSGWFYNPIYNRDGDFLGNTKEGFVGEPLIYSGDKDINWSKLSAKRALNKDGVDTYDNLRNQLSNDAKSNIWTNFAAKFKGKSVNGFIFSLYDLDGGKIHFDGKGDYNWAATLTPMLNSGKHQILGTDKYRDYETTVENVQASIIFHEWYGHVKMGYKDGSLQGHYNAYDAVMNSPIYNKTTQNYKSFIESQRDSYFGKFKNKFGALLGL